MNCVNGHAMEPGEKFCGGCGAPLRPGAVAGQQPPSAAPAIAPDVGKLDFAYLWRAVFITAIAIGMVAVGLKGSFAWPVIGGIILILVVIISFFERLGKLSQH